MKSANKIVYIVAGNTVAVDPMLPLVLSLARYGSNVETVFLSRYTFEGTKKSSSWWRWIERYTKYYCLDPEPGANVLVNWHYKIRRKLFFWNLSFRRNQIVFYPMNPDKKTLDQLKGNPHVWYYQGGLMFDADKRAEIQKRVERLSPEKLVILKGKKKKKKNPLHVPRILAFSEKSLTFARPNTWDKSLIISAPHMQKWWSDFEQTNPPHYDHDMIDRAEKIITVILLRKSNYYFAEGSDADILLDEIVTAIREYHPDTLIVLKPKYELRPFSYDPIPFWLSDSQMKTRYGNNIVLSYDSLITLSQKSLFAVSTGQSSGVYYMLSRNVPVIEYCRYSKLWQEIYPEKTYIEEDGGMFAENIEKLKEHIKNIHLSAGAAEKLKSKINYKDTKLDAELFVVK